MNYFVHKNKLRAKIELFELEVLEILWVLTSSLGLGPPGLEVISMVFVTGTSSVLVEKEISCVEKVHFCGHILFSCKIYIDVNMRKTVRQILYYRS